jgi:hypothetical protein
VNRIEYQGTFWFPVTPAQMWAAIERFDLFDLFESWWAWPADFGADEGGLLPGNVLRGTVVTPVPYRLRLDVRLRRCDRPRLIEAAIGGDLRGRAALRLEAADDGTRAGVAWSLQMHSAPLRVAAHVAHPLMRWCHDHVVDMAVAGFRRRALPGTPRPPEHVPIGQGGAPDLGSRLMLRTRATAAVPVRISHVVVRPGWASSSGRRDLLRRLPDVFASRAVRVNLRRPTNVVRVAGLGSRRAGGG